MNGTSRRLLKRPRGAPSPSSAATFVSFVLSPSSIGSIATVLGVVYVYVSIASFRAISKPSGTPGVEPIVLKAQEQVHVDQFHTDPYLFDRKRAEAALKKYGRASIQRILTAYVEPPLNDTIPGTGSRGDMTKVRDVGEPPDFRVPLPLRTHKPSDLRKIEYPKVQSCRDMPEKFPIDRGLEIDSNGDVVVWNVGNTPTPDDFPEKEAPFCPVEMDPFLPWIHDVFPSQDGSRLEFVAQNKRRCRTGSKFTKDVNRLVPQVALMQSISVQRIDDEQARRLAPELWHPDGPASDPVSKVPRYRLAPFEESSQDGKFTRFICRFHGTLFPEGGPPQSVVVGETLSEFPFNYDFVSYRKGNKASHGLHTPKGKDTELFWTSNIRFHCPVPESLRKDVAAGTTILSDGTPTLYVDLVPIRTSTRYSEYYLTEDQIGPLIESGVSLFDPVKRWGAKNVVPFVEASGRWANIPLCSPPSFSTKSGGSSLVPSTPAAPPKKPFFLSACLWASAEFKTRGHARMAHSDTLTRLVEWIEFHKLVGFDHFFLFDNSGAHTNETSLAEIADRYPGIVTRIDWPAIPCNNNIPAHDSTGERSSQYAAENACRTRYAPFTEWIVSFDTDEYLVPMGKYESLKDVLRDADASGTQVLSFKSSRGKLREDKCDEVDNGLRKKEDNTFLETYNCDGAGSPKPSWAERAKKEVYKSDFVLYHYVHYSTVTKDLLETQAQAGGRWSRLFHQQKGRFRATDEVNEAVMVHTKSVVFDQTKRYKVEACHTNYTKKWQGCFVGFPWPGGVAKVREEAYDARGLMYNCFINEKVEDYWVPRLQNALQKRKESWGVS
jgi:Glycosyltransferase family 92